MELVAHTRRKLEVRIAHRRNNVSLGVASLSPPVLTPPRPFPPSLSSFDFLVQLPASESKGATSLGHAFRVKYVLTSSDGGDIDFGLATATIRSPAVESVLAASSKYVAAAPLSVAAAPRKGSDDPNFQRRCLAKAGYSTIEWQLLHEVAPVAPALLRSEKDTAGGRVDGTVVLPATTRLLLMRFKSQQRVRWLSWGVPSRKISMRLAVEPIS